VSTPREQFELLCAAIERSLPSAAVVLRHPLAALDRVLDADPDAVGPALDRLEDLLDAVMQQARWGQP